MKPPARHQRVSLGPASAASETPVQKAAVANRLRFEDVAAIHDKLGGLHEGGGLLEIEDPEFIPLGYHYRRVRPSQGLVRVEDDLRVRGEAVQSCLASHGIVTYDLSSSGLQHAGY